MIRVKEVEPTSAEAQILIDELSALLASEYGSSGRDGFDPETEESGVFLIAFQADELAGCGALRPLSEQPGVAEIKRMYSRPGTKGVGYAVLAALEARALRLGFTSVWLETRRANVRAVGFYSKSGFSEREPYGKYVGRLEAICMEKHLST